MKTEFDVAIVGGGPAGSTCATLLKRYAPSLEVAVFEGEKFPRDHVGESMLPPSSPILDEMGVWDKIEAAGFPIKVGATYRWGRKKELWDVEFLPASQFRNEPRPAKYQGQRRLTSFQVDRSIYDQILLDHAESLGVEVFQETKVAHVVCEQDRVDRLQLQDGQQVRARHYVDASGNSGILRRALDIPCHFPASLKNIAIYDYWQNAEWAIKIGVGGTRIQVLSLGYGWIWFIPIGPTRSSIGLVVPAEYYKKSGKRPEDLYRQALAEESIVSGLIKNATCEQRLVATRDWSFIADRQIGPNWVLVGEAAGFADPILSAGVCMAHIGARQAAYTILELDRGQLDPTWLRGQYERRQKQRIDTHIRFGDFWYSSNEQFKELQEFTSQLAKDIGLEMSPAKAWQWIATGGFINEDLNIGSGGFSLGLVRDSGEYLGEKAFESPLELNNVFTLNVEGAVRQDIAVYDLGKIAKAPCLCRGERVLPITGEVEIVIRLLRRSNNIAGIVGGLNAYIERNAKSPHIGKVVNNTVPTLEAMIHDGWVTASYDPKLGLAKIAKGAGLKWNDDQVVP